MCRKLNKWRSLASARSQFQPFLASDRAQTWQKIQRKNSLLLQFNKVCVLGLLIQQSNLCRQWKWPNLGPKGSVSGKPLSKSWHFSWGGEGQPMVTTCPQKVSLHTQLENIFPKMNFHPKICWLTRFVIKCHDSHDILFNLWATQCRLTYLFSGNQSLVSLKWRQTTSPLGWDQEEKYYLTRAPLAWFCKSFSLSAHIILNK